MKPWVCDGHVHIGDTGRIKDLQEYVSQLKLDGVVLLSLPVAGAESRPGASVRTGSSAGNHAGRQSGSFGEHGPDGADRVNFNPEVLAAGAMLENANISNGGGPGGCRAWMFGSLDNRSLLDSRDRSAAWEPDRQVNELHAAGFSGIKLWEGKPMLQRTLGITLDHPALIDAYRHAGELGMPVLAHVADPIEFWQPGGLYAGEDVPGFEELQRQAAAVCDAAPETTWIFPHLLFLAGFEDRLSRFLEDHENAYLDLAPGNYFYTALAGADCAGVPRDPRLYHDTHQFFRRYRYRIIAGSDAFFLPPDLSVLPGTSLADNLERFLRLRRFLSTVDTQVSPYGYAADHPLFLGIGMSEDELAPILGTNIWGIMTRLAERFPRTTPPDPYPWLDRWEAETPSQRSRDRARRVRSILAALHR